MLFLSWSSRCNLLRNRGPVFSAKRRIISVPVFTRRGRSWRTPTKSAYSKRVRNRELCSRDKNSMRSRSYLVFRLIHLNCCLVTAASPPASSAHFDRCATNHMDSPSAGVAGDVSVAHSASCGFGEKRREAREGGRRSPGIYAARIRGLERAPPCTHSWRCGLPICRQLHWLRYPQSANFKSGDKSPHSK